MVTLFLTDLTLFAVDVMCKKNLSGPKQWIYRINDTMSWA